MLILGRDQMKDPSLGYARTFVRQAEDCLGIALEKGVRIVANAGGLNPAGLAERLREVAAGLGLSPHVAHVEGDAPGRPRRRARAAGQAADRERLPGRLRHRRRPAARRRRRRHRPGHRRVAGGRPGRRRVRLDADVVRRAGRRRGRGPRHRVRHPGHRWELQRLHGVDRAARLPDRRGARRRVERHHQARRHRRGRLGGHRDRAAGLRDPGTDLPRPRRLHAPRHGRPQRRRPRPGADLRRAGVSAAGDVEGVRQRARRLPQPGRARARRPRHRREGCLGARAGRPSALAADPPAAVEWSLARTDHEDADTEEAASCRLRVSVRDEDPNRVGKAFTAPLVELALASYPGFTLTAPPAPATPYGVYRAAAA